MVKLLTTLGNSIPLIKCGAAIEVNGFSSAHRHTLEHTQHMHTYIPCTCPMKTHTHTRTHTHTHTHTHAHTHTTYITQSANNHNPHNTKQRLFFSCTRK